MVTKLSRTPYWSLKNRSDIFPNFKGVIIFLGRLKLESAMLFRRERVLTSEWAYDGEDRIW